MKTTKNIVRWIVTALLGIMAGASLSEGGIFSALLFLLGAVIVSPLDFVADLGKN